MKFGKLLKLAAKEMPENSDLVLRFKQLKKQLKLLKPAEADADAEAAEISLGSVQVATNSDERLENLENCATECSTSKPSEAAKSLSHEERSFLQTLNEDLDRFNDFFIDKEEDFIIRARTLEDSMEGETDTKRLRHIRKAYTDLHGDMILLLHWSLLNFTAVVKILKKHDKCSGTLLRQPLLSSVLKQPFNSTERITKLIKEAETKLQLLLKMEEVCTDEGIQQMHADEDVIQSLKEQQAELSRRTKAALDVWEEMRANASTPSTVLPLEQKGKAGERPEEPAAGTPAPQEMDCGRPSVTPQEGTGGSAKRQKQG